jgi:hypothetical protein
VTVRSPLLKASSILLSDGWFVFVTNAVGFLSGALSSSGTVGLAILYSPVIGDDSQDFSWLNRPVLHLGNVGGLADGGWSLRLLSDSAGIERSLFDQLNPVRSLIVSVRGEGFYWISCEREGRIGFLAEPGDRPGFWVNSSGRFVPTTSVVWMESQTPLPTATAVDSLAFLQSAKLSRSAVAEASLCFNGSDVVKSAALLPSRSPPASPPLAPESSTIGCSARARHSELTNSDGFLHSGLPDSEGFLHSGPADSENFMHSRVRSSEGFPQSEMLLSLLLAPESCSLSFSVRFVQSGLPDSDGFVHSGLPDSEGFPGEGEPSSGRSATIGAVVGGCVAGIALCAGVAAFVIAVARRRACGHDRTAGSPAGVEVDLVDEVEDEEDAVSFANPLDSIDVFAGTV